MTTPSVLVSVAGRTDVGRTRDHNEDTYLVADLSTGAVEVDTDGRPHPIGERGALFMVADGMGGAAAGELASELAAQTIHAHLMATWAHDDERTSEKFAFRVREAVEEANRKIHAYAAEHPDVRGMGTTVTAAGVFGSHLFLAQIGDSRAYLVRRGVATQLTKDQSLTQRLVDAGEMTEEQAEKSERKNIILQALGPDPQVRVELTFEELRQGDVLILCSDGLSGQVRRPEFAEHADRLPDLSELCGTLIDLANTRGGPDNITVVAVRFDGPGLPLSTTAPEPGHHVVLLPGDEPEEDTPGQGYTTSDRLAAYVPPAAEAPAPMVRPRPPVGLIGTGVLLLAALLYYLITR
ncbi:MAG TPA: protein phosphatase 2C domain-containing protein [Gemmatimonadales bacterium]|nr:protein phosphatase 2C domain-containing protein [Gemmatimonadales bacterium]